MFGIRSAKTPRWVRMSFAVGTAVAGCLILALRASRFDWSLAWYDFVVAGLVCGVIGYHGCTWERER